MSNVEEVTNIDELESGEEIPTFDYTNYVDVTLTEKHYYDNPKYNDGIHYTTKKHCHNRLSIVLQTVVEVTVKQQAGKCKPLMIFQQRYGIWKDSS